MFKHDKAGFISAMPIYGGNLYNMVQIPQPDD